MCGMLSDADSQRWPSCSSRFGKGEMWSTANISCTATVAPVGIDRHASHRCVIQGTTPAFKSVRRRRHGWVMIDQAIAGMAEREPCPQFVRSD